MHSYYYGEPKVRPNMNSQVSISNQINCSCVQHRKRILLFSADGKVTKQAHVEIPHSALPRIYCIVRQKWPTRGLIVCLKQ